MTIMAYSLLVSNFRSAVNVIRMCVIYFQQDGKA